ncbi:hypothetical protein STEG23_025067 [Scotinomys teguina]
MFCGLPVTSTSCLLHGRLATLLPCCLALDSSSSFPCPAFLAIAKSDMSVKRLIDMDIQDERNHMNKGHEGDSVLTSNSSVHRKVGTGAHENRPTFLPSCGKTMYTCSINMMLTAIHSLKIIRYN